MEKQKTLHWDDSAVEMVAADLRRAFPGSRGFSANSVWLMRQFLLKYSSPQFLEQAVQEMRWRGHLFLEPTVPEAANPDCRAPSDEPQSILERLVQGIFPVIPWGHHVEIVKKVKAPAARLWYFEATARLGWSRNVLLNQIKAGAYERARMERKLFYHRFLKALVAFELKVGPFEPEYAGKMDFYLNLLNDRERSPGDQPSIGVILCAEKDDIEVEYALRTKANPIGVATYALQPRLPAEMKGKLPSARQLKAVVRSVLPEG